MRVYQYTAIKNQKEIVKGYIEAEDLDDARVKIKGFGFLPTAIYEEDKKKISNTNKQIVKLSQNDLINFTSELYTYTISGISMLSALDNIAKHSPVRKISVFAEQLSTEIKNGKTFTEALEGYSDVVGETYFALCKTGEESGALSATLGYLKDLLNKQKEIRDKFIRMSIYPAILVIAMIVVFFILGGFAFPRLINFIGIDAEIPKVALFFTTGFKMITQNWWLFILAAGYGIYGWFNIFDQKRIKRQLQNFLIKIPILRECMTYIALSHYMTVLHISYEAGVPITEVLRLAENSLINKDLNKKAKTVTTLVAKGENISDAYEKSGLIPEIFMPLIKTGEQTGKLGQMFRDIYLAISMKLDNAIDAVSRAFEPILMCIIGIFVAITAIAVIQIYVTSLTMFTMF